MVLWMNKHTYIKVSKINLFYASIVFPFAQIFLIFTIINKGSLFFIHRLSQNIFALILNIKDMYYWCSLDILVVEEAFSPCIRCLENCCCWWWYDVLLDALFEKSALPGRVGLLPSTFDIEWVEPPILPRAPLAVAGLAGNGGGWEFDELQKQKRNKFDFRNIQTCLNKFWLTLL